jgi:hypothetical protein
MPPTAYPALMSQREVVRWMRGPRSLGDLDDLAARVQQRVGTALPEQLVEEIDDVRCEALLEGEERVLLLVGTLLVHNDQHLLWSMTYDAVMGDGADDDDDEMRFLEEKTVIARRGEL